MKNFLLEQKFWIILTVVHSLWLLSDVLSGRETSIIVTRLLVLIFLLLLLFWEWRKWEKK